jgi:hypothetical protein
MWRSYFGREGKMIVVKSTQGLEIAVTWIIEPGDIMESGTELVRPGLPTIHMPGVFKISGAQVLSGGFVHIYSLPQANGEADNTIVNSGGVVEVDGGDAVGSKVLPGGTLNNQSGTASDTMVAGSMSVSGGIAFGTIVTGSFTVDSGGHATDTTADRLGSPP